MFFGKNQKRGHRNYHSDCREEITVAHSGKEENDKRVKHNKNRRGKIVLHIYQAEEKSRNQHRRQNAGIKIVNVAGFLVQKMRKVQRKSELYHFGRLIGEGTDFNPARSAVPFHAYAGNTGQDAKSGGEQQEKHDHFSRNAKIDPGEKYEKEQSRRGETKLPVEKVIAVIEEPYRERI